MKYLIKNKYWKLNKDYNKEKLLYLLIDRPDRISIYNEFIWEYKKKHWHRNYNFPAVIDCDGELWWYKNGFLYESNEIFKKSIKKH